MTHMQEIYSNLPLIKRCVVSAVDAKREDGTLCKAFVVTLYSEPNNNPLYVVSQVLLSESGIANLKKTLEEIAKDYPTIFPEAGTAQGHSKG